MLNTDSALVHKFRTAVEIAGADWCGIQDGLEPSPNLILFTSRKTGSTLAVPFYHGEEEIPCAVFVERIRYRIVQSDLEFEKVCPTCKRKLPRRKHVIKK